jgi:tRNA-specific 2-thiouridylase
VDSSTSAAILKQEGYDVTGVFIKVWQPDFLPCTWKEDRLDAMRVAAHLDIPFITMDFAEEYKRDVVDYMIREYKAGRTPNPDVMCNKYIKFGAFYREARMRGADFVATGHYARTDGAHLLTSADKEKDQSYFLWTLSGAELSHIFFPVGGYEKKDVRVLAEKFKLPTAKKKDSQGLCFVGKLDMKDFLKEFIPPKEGQVLSESGEVVGRHEGAWFYTIGQRHGFDIFQKTPAEEKMYVVAKNVRENTITVSPRKMDEESGAVSEVVLEETNWIAGAPEEGKTYTAQTRYHGTAHECTVSIKDGETKVVFSKPHMAPSGQSLVLYDGDICLGGGIIR